MNLIAVDTETQLWSPLGTKKINLRVPCPDVVCTTYAVRPLTNREGIDISLEEYAKRLSGDGLISWHNASGVAELFNHDDTTYVFHNVAFDLGVLAKAYPELKPRFYQLIAAGRILDTRVMYLLRDPDPPNKSVTLADLSLRLLGKPMEKGAVRTSFSRHVALSAEQKAYATLDAEVTLKCAQKMLEMPYGSKVRAGHRQKQIAAAINPNLESPDVVYSRAAAYMAWNLVPVGMRVDPVELAEQHAKLTDKVVECREELLTLDAGTYERLPKSTVTQEGTFDGKPTAYLRKWRYDVDRKCMVRIWKGVHESAPAKFKLKVGELREAAEELAAEREWRIRRTDSGQISLKRDYWAGKGDLPADLEAYMTYQKWNKYLTSYTQPLVEANAREVFPNYFVPGAATGRWACSKPNLQNVPKKKGERESLRGIYIPREGHVFVTADYPTLELFTLAQTMYDMGIDGPLRETLNSGADIHTRTASLMTGKNEEHVTKDERQIAKMCNFGLPGGMGPKAFLANAIAQGYTDWTYWDARRVRGQWLATYWDVGQYLAQLDIDPWDYYRGPGNLAGKLQWLQDVVGMDIEEGDEWPSNFEILQQLQDGRLYTATLSTGRVIPDRRYSMVANCFFQGLGADIVTRAFNRLSELRWPVCSVVHDSIMLEIENETEMVEQAKLYLNETMRRALAEVCPDLVPRDMDVEVLERWV